MAAKAIKAKSTFALKDNLFNPASVAVLAGSIASVYPEFEAAKFGREVVEGFGERELKARIEWIVQVLGRHLPGSFAEALQILTQALPKPLDPRLTDDDFGQFIWVVPGEYAATYGCTQPSLEMSLDFLRNTTMRFSAENAIRPFLQEFPEETLAFVQRCAKDRNYHVRRLASEGIRPFLPWSPRVVLPLPKIIEVLDLLHADPTRYVTRSVANNLNDIAKIDSPKVLQTLLDWRGAAQQDADELDWMTRHAVRTLIKQDNSQALALLGYSVNPDVSVGEIQASRTVTVGGDFDWQAELLSNADQPLVVKLRIFFRKANGELSPKVFAMKEGRFAKGDVLSLRKKQSFVPRTTRTLYPGKHEAELVINGVAHERVSFTLQA